MSAGPKSDDPEVINTSTFCHKTRLQIDTIVLLVVGKEETHYL